MYKTTCKWLGVMEGLELPVFAPCTVLESERCTWPFETSLTKTSAHQVDQFSMPGKWRFEGSTLWTQAPWVLLGQQYKSCLYSQRDSVMQPGTGCPFLQFHLCSPCEAPFFSSQSFCLSASEQLLHSVDFIQILFGWILSKVTSAT